MADWIKIQFGVVDWVGSMNDEIKWVGADLHGRGKFLEEMVRHNIAMRPVPKLLWDILFPSDSVAEVEFNLVLLK